MSQYFIDDFSSLTGWTKRYNTTPTWTGANPLAIPNGVNNDWTGLSLDAVDGDAGRATLDIQFKFSTPATIQTTRFLFFRGSGADESATHVHFSMLSSAHSLGYCDGSDTRVNIVSHSTSYSGSTTYRGRINANGSALKTKVWLDGDPEPGSWQIDTSDPTVTAAGWIGFCQNGNVNTPSIHWIGIGTGGDSAPTAPIGGTDDTADGVTVSASASLVAGTATGQVNATATGQTLTATASLVAGAAAGQVNATASGATVSAAASLIPGAATGESGGTAAGTTVTATASLIPGAAQGEQNATAAGQTLTASASLIAGAASGGSTGTAAGATVQASAALLPGAATGEQSATAAGATITATASLQAGTATAGQDATAGGALLSVGVAIIAGAASAANDATAAGVVIDASAQFLAGAANGQADATAAGVVISLQAALIAGGAFGPASSTTRGYTARLADRPRRAVVTGGATRTAKRAA